MRSIPLRYRVKRWREVIANKIVRLGLRLVPDDNLIRHAREELRRAGLFDKDSSYGGMLGHSTINLMKLFALEGHSGFSAGMQTSIFDKVSRFEPLTPLTGADDEWFDHGPATGGARYQNKRCSHVFKDEAGNAYDSHGKVFRERNGATYSSRDSRVRVMFPYTPTTEVVDVPEGNH